METKIEPQKFKRKKYFIGSQVQKLFLIFSISMGLMAVLIIRVYDFLVSLAGENQIVPFLSVGVFVIFFTYIFLGLVISNKIAGPLFRIETAIRAYLEKGEVQDITLRDGDLFGELADLVSRMMKAKK